MRDWFVLGQSMPSANQKETTTAVEAKPESTEKAVTTQPGSQPAPQANGFVQFLTSIGPLILIFVVMYFFMFRGQRKEEKKRKQMLSELKRGDRIMTIGGLKGTVTEIREADDEVVIKIDESSNVKAIFIRSAIQKVVDTDTKTESK